MQATLGCHFIPKVWGSIIVVTQTFARFDQIDPKEYPSDPFRGMDTSSEDIFDAVHNSEHTFINEGHEEGIKCVIRIE